MELGVLGGLFDTIPDKYLSPNSYIVLDEHTVPTINNQPLVSSILGDYVYYLCGNTIGQECYKINVNTREVTALANIPGNRHSVPLVNDNVSNMYVVGGDAGAYNPEPQQSIYKYDTLTDTWSTKTTPPGVITDTTPLYINGKIYTFYNYNWYIYDTTTDTWTTQAMTAPYTLLGHKCYDGNDTIYHFRSAIWQKISLSTFTVTLLSSNAASLSYNDKGKMHYIDNDTILYHYSTSIHEIKISSLTSTQIKKIGLISSCSGFDKYGDRYILFSSGLTNMLFYRYK